MELDYVERTGYYTLRMLRQHPQMKTIMLEHGLDLSTAASTPDEAVLFTDNMYAAMTYADSATPRALKQFGALLPELASSRSLGSNTKYPIGHKAREAGHDLFPFQRAGVDYALRRNAALIGDDMGLGKTPMGIVIANEIRAQRVLVVCPANVRLQWAERVREWSTLERPIVYPILKSSDGVHPAANWTIVSFDLLRSQTISRVLAASTFDLIIVDEAHYLKTSRTQRTKAIFGPDGLAGNAGMILALTGTPLPNRPRECFTLSKGLCWDAIDFMKEDAFQARFNPVRVGVTASGKRYSVEKTGRLHELQNRLRANFMVRRRKRDVLDQLPEIRYDIVHVTETEGVQKALEAEKMLDIDPENLAGVDAKILGHISVVRKMMGVAKAPQVADYVDYIMAGGEEKLVVFGWHIEVLDMLEARFAKHGCVRIDGSTSALRRQRLVKQFGDDPAIKIFLGNLQSVGVGVDGLQKVCNRGLFAESSWTPADNDQGVGRLERIGQKSGIIIEFMVAPGSFDERILGTSLRKLQDIHTSLDATI